MRKRVVENGLTANAVAGSYVVVLGLDIKESMRQGLRGFAVKREEKTEGESFWVSGMKTFASVEPHPAPGRRFSSREHPLQTFQWSDYSAQPGFTYTYTVVPMYGEPGALEGRNPVKVTVKTESVEGQTHTIHFNRGSVATQEYARRFNNIKPSVAGPEAYKWLSRGLFEGITGFINRATGKGFSLHGAFYEFQWGPVLAELAAAKKRKVDVQIVFDCIESDGGPRAANTKAIKLAKIGAFCTPRSNGKLMHNKFLVLLEGKKPKAVMFGGTNLTENGIYGHANFVHICEDADIAAKYLAYFEKLKTDPETTKASGYKDWTIENTPAPPVEFVRNMAAVFSPRANLEALEWYGKMAGEAKDALFMTFAFGMNQIFRDIYGKKDGVLRFGVMEKEWNGANKEAQIAAIRAVQKLPNTTIAIGNHIPLNGFDRWLGEPDKIVAKVNVHWVHTKMMMIDPLSDDPIIVAGSANFSDASTKTNDENMMVIRGNKRVADIYLGEYMRLYAHYAFREAVKIFLEKNPGATAEDMKQGSLIEDGDWTEPYFDANDRSGRSARRTYFAGRA